MIRVVMLKQGGGPVWVRELAPRAATEMAEFPPGAVVIFTDDRALIEEMTRRMLLESKKP
jgi:hypothetical protein